MQHMAPSSTRRLAIVWVLFGLSLLATVLIVASHPSQESLAGAGAGDQIAGTEIEQKPALFNFANYKQLFKKTYSGILEELARKRLFFARALRVFIAAVKFQHLKQLYYLAINYMSDATPEELDKMRNRALDGEAGRGLDESGKVNTEAPLLADISSDDDIEANLRKLVKERPNDPAMKELNKFLTGDGAVNGESRRKKRNVASQPGKLRELPMDKLINTGDNVHLDPEVEAKMVSRVPKNNPDYVAREPESQGLVDEQKAITQWMRELSSVVPTYYEYFPDNVKKNIELGLKDAFYSKVDDKDSEQTEHYQLPDEVFYDLRETKCLTLPRSQGQCGSCYAFAMTAIVEWLYCKATGKLVEFSEQYMVDCGNEYVDGIYGCEGGNRLSVAKFVANFGLELRSNYPYTMRNGTCPYTVDQPLKTTGYIRYEMNDMYNVKLVEVSKLIQNGPMFVIITTDRTTSEYGGGVYGLPCNSEAKEMHAVVLVGHGRENGREYWLIRNSWSIGWGEGGYLKLDKTVGGICHNMAYMYATKDGGKLVLKPQFNRNNDPSKLGKLKAAPSLRQATRPIFHYTRPDVSPFL